MSASPRRAQSRGLWRVSRVSVSELGDVEDFMGQRTIGAFGIDQVGTDAVIMIKYKLPFWYFVGYFTRPDCSLN